MSRPATFLPTPGRTGMRRLERTHLFETPAAYDDPLEMLLGAHRRIEKALETLKRLRVHVESRGVDAQASADAQALLAYFRQAAEKHHRDEEHDVFPLLESRIDDPGEQARFRAFRESLHQDHRALQLAWGRLRKPLEGIGEGLVRALPQQDVEAFVGAYVHHIVTEETSLKEFFDRWLDDGDRRALCRAMVSRRSAG